MKTQPTGSSFYLLSSCLVATLGGMLFGYDTGVINGSLQFVESHFNLSPEMKGFAASSALLACIPGAILAGLFGDWLGRRKTLMISGLLFLISAIGTALPHDINTFIIFRIIGGIGVGAASMTSPMYIAEIAPARIRGRLVSLNQLAIVGGMLMVYFVNYFIADPVDNSWNISTGWRWMFGSEALPAAALFILTFFIPETPRWLSMHGRKKEARAILAKIEGEETADEEMATIEESLSEEKAGFAQLFKPAHFKLLALGLTLAFLQQATGINVFLYFGSEIFPNKIRSLAMATCTVFLWLTNSVVSQTFVMMDKNETLLEKYNHGFPFFIYGALCIVTILFVIFCLPETKGRSLESE